MSTMGRRACEVLADSHLAQRVGVTAQVKLDVDWELALKKVYGDGAEANAPQMEGAPVNAGQGVSWIDVGSEGIKGTGGG